MLLSAVCSLGLVFIYALFQSVARWSEDGVQALMSIYAKDKHICKELKKLKGRSSIQVRGAETHLKP